ncbi:MAG: hypothetical protein WB661_13175 [Candidatus Bathyarchaeia archaeon]
MIGKTLSSQNNRFQLQAWNMAGSAHPAQQPTFDSPEKSGQRTRTTDNLPLSELSMCYCGTNILLTGALGLDGFMTRKDGLLRAVALTAFVFGLLVWVYVVVIQVTYPEWLTTRFSHVNIFPFNWRLDEVGMTAFAVAAVGFLVWQIELNAKNR